MPMVVVFGSHDGGWWLVVVVVGEPNPWAKNGVLVGEEVVTRLVYGCAVWLRRGGLGRSVLGCWKMKDLGAN